jgi:SAM-dependent methyltransferase
MEREAGFAREVGRGLSAEALPAYAPMLAAYHRAHRDELRAMVADLPLFPGDRVLDMACGDGAYSVWLAERVGRAGAVVGVDISPAYLAQARSHANASGWGKAITFRQGDIAELPFEDNSFDLAWCAQSMYSLPDPAAALRELRRVTRPGGHVAIFENDTLHQLVLPWPPDLELAVREAQLAALSDESPEAAKFFIGRDLRAALAEAGLADIHVSSYTTTRRAPLSPDERAYLSAYFDDLGHRARPRLDAHQQQQFDALFTPGSPDHLIDQPDFYVTYIDLVAYGRK